MTATDLVIEMMPGAGPFDIAGDYYLNVPSTGASASTPHTGVLGITGDIHIRAEVTLEDWTPSANRTFASKYGAAGQRSWWFALLTTGQMFLQWSTDGTAVITRICTIPISSGSGTLAVGVKLDVSNGGNHVCTFETAPSMVGTWADLAEVTTAGTTSLFNASSTALQAGNVTSAGNNPLGGRLHKLEVRDGILGTVRANPDFTAQSPGTTSFSDAAGRSWTVNSPASIDGFDWVDLSDRLLQAEWSWGRENELDPFEPGVAELLLKNDDRVLDPEYSAGTYFGELNPRTPVRIQSVATALDLPGAGGATASTPDHSTFNVTDLDVRVRLAVDDWTPGGLGQFVVGQWPNSPGNNGWVLAVQPSGVLRLATTANGTTTINHDSTAATGYTDGSDHWIRATIDVDNGAAGHDVRFYTSDDGVTWTQLGTTVTTGGTTSIFNSTAVVSVGDVLSLAGQVRYVEVRDGIAGSIVTNPEFSSQPAGTTSFKCPQGRTWTVNGSASIVLDTAVRQDEFYGFVESGWVQQYEPPELANCRLQLTDMLGVITGASLPRTAYELEVLADNALAYWTLDETDGTQMGDSSGNGRHGTFDNSILGEDPLIADGGHSLSCPNDGDNRGYWSGQGLPVGPSCTLEAWVRLPRDLLSVKSIIVAQRDSSLSSALWFKVDSSVGSPNGELQIHFHGLGSYQVRGDARVDDDRTHHVVCTIGGTTNADVLLYVDSVLQTKTTVTAGTNGSWASHLLWTVGNTIDNGVGDYGLGGLIDEVAIYDFVLHPTRITEHYEAGSTGFDGETTGARINRVLNHIGLPESMRDLADGDTTIGPANYGGSKAGTYLDGVVESEQGVLYVDHRNAGKLTFRGRYHRLTETRSTTTLATFTDENTSAALHYERGIRVDPGTAKNVVNVVDVNWRGGTVQVVDPNGSHLPGGVGPQSRTITTEAPTASAAASAGAWLINNYAAPQPRVRGFALNPGPDKRLRRPARDLRISDRIATVRQPQSVGTATTNLLYVEGITHTFEKGLGWTVEVDTSTAVLGDWWIWGVSTWGETAIWG